MKKVLVCFFLLWLLAKPVWAQMPWSEAGTALDVFYGQYGTKPHDQHGEVDLEFHLHSLDPVMKWFMLGFEARTVIDEVQLQPNVYALRAGLVWNGETNGISMWGGFQPDELFSDDPAKAWVSGVRFWLQDHGDRVVVGAKYSHEDKFTYMWGNLDFDVFGSAGMLGLAFTVNSNGPLFAGVRASYGFEWARIGFQLDGLISDLRGEGGQFRPETPILGLKIFAGWY